MSKVTGYKGDKTAWCVACANERYGVANTPLTHVKDRNGAYIEEILSTDRGDGTGQFCTRCGRVIVTPTI
jgi:hypothetical protein